MRHVSESMFFTIGQAAAGPGGSGSGRVASNQVLFNVGLLLLVLLVGAVAVFLLRRKLLGAESGVDATTGLMESMRRMRDSGEMTVEEYEAARKSMAHRAARSMGVRRTGDARPAERVDNPPGT